MLKISGNKIYLTRGDSAVLALAIKDSEDNTYDYSGDTVKFALKKNVGDKDILISKTFDEDGQISFSPADTASLGFGDYVYDIQLEHMNDEVKEVATVIIPSTFTIGAEVN